LNSNTAAPALDGSRLTNEPWPRTVFASAKAGAVRKPERMMASLHDTPPSKPGAINSDNLGIMFLHGIF
jgi:hypothetical protein